LFSVGFDDQNKKTFVVLKKELKKKPVGLNYSKPTISLGVYFT